MSGSLSAASQIQSGSGCRLTGVDRFRLLPVVSSVIGKGELFVADSKMKALASDLSRYAKGLRSRTGSSILEFVDITAGWTGSSRWALVELMSRFKLELRLTSKPSVSSNSVTGAAGL